MGLGNSKNWPGQLYRSASKDKRIRFDANMIYQINYDNRIKKTADNRPRWIQPVGVYKVKNVTRKKQRIYDHEDRPNLAEHNTLCEWWVLYFVWKNFPSAWVGLKSWQHDKKKFTSQIYKIGDDWIHDSLESAPITGFMARPLHAVIVKNNDTGSERNLKNQFTQLSHLEQALQKEINDTRRTRSCLNCSNILEAILQILNSPISVRG
jgi:hypothetical protein